MNIYMIVLLCLYAINAIRGLWCLSKGTTPMVVKPKTYGDEGFTLVLGVVVGLVLLLGAVGII